MRYLEATKEDLVALERGLDIISRIDPEKVAELDVCLYAIVQDPFILDIAKEAIINSTEEYLDDYGDPKLTESDVQLSEVAIAIPLSGNNLYHLFGSGVDVYRMEFAYKMGEGEGVRTKSFFEANTTSVKVNFSKLGETALADGDFYIDEFLTDKGKGTPAQVERKVQRTEEATSPTPHVPETPPAEPAPQPVAKQTSLVGGLKISDCLENFLGN